MGRLVKKSEQDSRQKSLLGFFRKPLGDETNAREPTAAQSKPEGAIDGERANDDDVLPTGPSIEAVDATTALASSEDRGVHKNPQGGGVSAPHRDAAGISRCAAVDQITSSEATRRRPRRAQADAGERGDVAERRPPHRGWHVHAPFQPERGRGGVRGG